MPRAGATTAGSTTSAGSGVTVAGIVERKVALALKAYSAARSEFVGACKVMLEDPEGGGVALSALVQGDLMALLCCPLTSDPAPSIKATSLACLSKLAAAEPALGDALVDSGALEGVAAALGDEAAPVQVAADGVVQALAAGSGGRHAEGLIRAGVGRGLVAQLDSPRPEVVEAAVKAINVMAASSPALADELCTGRSLALLVALLRTPGSSGGLRRAVLAVLTTVAAMGPDAAEDVVKAGLLPVASSLLHSPSQPPELQTRCLACLAAAAAHSAALAQQVVGGDALRPAFQALTDPGSPALRAASAALLLEVARRSPELARALVTEGGAPRLVAHMRLDAGAPSVTSVMLAGVMGSCPEAATALLEAGIREELAAAAACPDVLLSTTAAWAAQQLGAQGAQQATGLAEHLLLPLVSLYCRLGRARDGGKSRCKAKAAAKLLVRSCTAHEPLVALVAGGAAPPELLHHALQRLAALMEPAAATAARQAFVATGALQATLLAAGSSGRAEAAACGDGGCGVGQGGSKLQRAVQQVSHLFPAELVSYYGPAPSRRVTGPQSVVV